MCETCLGACVLERPVLVVWTDPRRAASNLSEVPLTPFWVCAAVDMCCSAEDVDRDEDEISEEKSIISRAVAAFAATS
jgi:hypothetical protein